MNIIANLAYISRNIKPSYSWNQKAILDKKYYNCHKIGYFEYDCRMQNFRLAKKKVSNIR